MVYNRADVHAADPIVPNLLASQLITLHSTYQRINNMKFTMVSALTMVVLPTAFAAPVAAPSLEQSPNVNALTERQVQIWVWACDTE